MQLDITFKLFSFILLLDLELFRIQMIYFDLYFKIWIIFLHFFQPSRWRDYQFKKDYFQLSTDHFRVGSELLEKKSSQTSQIAMPSTSRIDIPSHSVSQSVHMNMAIVVRFLVTEHKNILI